MAKHNRNSFDGNGTIIKNYVHYSNAYDNSGWLGVDKVMIYGDGGYTFSPLTSVDVFSHEIGHGVCNSTANLIYANESGAINEELSDIWGAMVEYFADPTKQTYLMGEEIKLGGGALRSMSNPKSYAQPDTYGGTNWYTGTNDNVGVHTNSGIMNHWFYILAEGKSSTNDIGNSYNIAGISKDKAAKIVYRAETVYFNATTNYSQARALTIQAANDLYGANSLEANTTCQSWYAVGIGSNCASSIAIVGDNLICKSTTGATYAIANLPPNTTPSWTVSSNLIKVSFSGSSIVIKPINTTVSGVASITASVNGQSFTKTIWIDKPQITVQLVSDSNYVDIYLVGANGTDIYNQGITATTWTKTASTNSGSAGGSGLQVFGHGPNFNWTVTLKITATNSCGITEITQVVTCAAPIPCGSISYILSTSNLNEYVINSMVIPCSGFNANIETTSLYNGKIDIRVYNFQGIEVMKSNTSTLNINQLNAGIYIIKVRIDNQVITSKIIKS